MLFQKIESIKCCNFIVHVPKIVHPFGMCKCICMRIPTIYLDNEWIFILWIQRHIVSSFQHIQHKIIFVDWMYFAHLPKFFPFHFYLEFQRARRQKKINNFSSRIHLLEWSIKNILMCLVDWSVCMCVGVLIVYVDV